MADMVVMPKADWVNTLDAIRAKTGSSDLLKSGEVAAAVEGIQTGGGGATAQEGDITFYDYDGTIRYSWTLDQLAAATELPAGPEHDGLVFQEWNWSLENLKATNRKMNVGATYTTDDGTTRVYIHLQEGRTSPMMGLGVNGTVTVDWGDGTTPDTLTGTSVSTTVWTPTHEYAAPGDYVIRLTVDGTMGFVGTSTSNQYSCILRYSSSTDARNTVYRNAVRKIEIGNGVTSIGASAFQACYTLAYITMPKSLTSIGSYTFNGCFLLASITIPDSVTSIGNSAFTSCYTLASITIPDSVTSISGYAFYFCNTLASITIPDSVTSIGSSTFQNCNTLASITIPDSVTSIGSSAFNGCYTLAYITISDSVTSIGDSAFKACNTLASITIPDSVTSIGSSAFNGCYTLAYITMPKSLTSIGNYAFQNCYPLASITIPDSVTSIGASAFQACNTLASITIPDSVTSIGSSAFQNCYSIRYFDFTNHTAVPTLSNTNAFTGIPADCEIRVPAALYDEWIAATNWSTYASQIVAV